MSFTNKGITPIAIFSLGLLFALTTTLNAEDILGQDRRSFADGLYARGLYRLAIPEYENLSKQTPPPQELDIILYRLAECKRQNGDLQGTVALCNRVLKEFPNGKAIFHARISLAQALDALGQKQQAATIFETIATDPAADQELRSLAMYFSGESRYASGDYNTAKIRFGMLLKMLEGFKPFQNSNDIKAYAKLYLADIDGRDPLKTDSALAQYKAIADSPVTPGIGAKALYKGAVLAFNSKKYEEAVSRFALLFGKYPNDALVYEAMLPAAWSNFNVGRYSEALTLAEKTAVSPVANNPVKAECAYIKASSLNKLLRRDEAVIAFDELISKYPNSSFADAARYERLVALFNDGAYLQVLRDAATISNPSPSFAADLIWIQAESAEALKDSSRAAQFYQMLANRHPDSSLAPDALYRYATHLRNNQNWLEAANAYQKLIASYKNSELIPYSLCASGTCYFYLEKFESAIRDFDKLITDYQGHKLIPEATFQKALSQEKLGQKKEAGATLDTLLADYPKFERNIDVKLARARISYERKDFGDAEKILKELLKSSPSQELSRETSFLLGLVLEAQGRATEAASQFQPLLEESFRDKIDPSRLAWLADFQFSQKKYNEAITAANELIKREITPELQQSAQVILARSQLALANTNAAALAFKAAADSPARTHYSAEAALRYGELILDDKSQQSTARRYLQEAARRASDPSLGAVRANAYYDLARLAELEGNNEEAIRLFLAMSLLYEDKELVTKAMLSASGLLKSAGRHDEAAAVEEDLKTRYPEGSK